MSNVAVKVDGLPQLLKRLRENAGAGKALDQGFHRIGLDASSASKRKVPVDVGLLRNRITYEVDRSPLPTFVKVGTLGGDNPGYAAYMEFGTGLVHDHPSWPRRRHIPFGGRDPKNGVVGGLVAWAGRKNRGRGGPVANASAVAYGIMKRGGIEPRRYLRGPFEAGRARYVRTIAEALRRMSLG